MNEMRALLEIIRSFMENREYRISGSLEEEKLYDLARKNKVSNFLVKWAKKDCQSEKIRNLILADYNAQIMRDTNQVIELERIFKCFEEEKVQTLVVKGVVMREVYPQGYMRKMNDVDLLVASGDYKKAVKLLKDLGYRDAKDTEHHLVFWKEPFMKLELHRKLIFR